MEYTNLLGMYNANVLFIKYTILMYVIYDSLVLF